MKMGKLFRMKMLKKYFKDESGNIALFTSLALLPVMAVIGVAVDMSMTANKKQTLQDAVDNAALAAIHETNRRRSFYTLLESLRGVGFDPKDSTRITRFNRREHRGHVTLNATVKGTHDLAFGALIDKPEADYSVSTSVIADKKITAVRFTPTFGSGYLNKEFNLWVIRPNVAEPERLATYRWTSSAPVTFPNGSSPGRLSSSQRGPVDLGDYTEFFMTTTVTDPWDTYTHEQLVEVYGEDYTLSSREPGHGDHFFLNGRQLAVNEQVNFRQDFSCDQRRLDYEWEDAPGLASPGTDFRFRVTAVCSGIDPDTLRIVR
jgi:hypothetical protein